MKLRNTSTAMDISTAGGRFNWLLRKIWGGSQSRMAEATGLSQSAISNVVTGRRAPGRKILATISAHPLVNGEWLLTGLGEPLVVEEQPGHGGQYFCPVAAGPLSGAPRRCREKLTGQYRPVAAPDFGENCYWLGVVGDDFSDKGVVSGDWLLMDAGGSWLERPEIIAGQPCVVQIGGRTAPAFVVRWLQYDAKAKPNGKYVIDVFAVADDKSEKLQSDRQFRKVVVRNLNSSTKKPTAPTTTTPPTRVLLKNVVAVAAKLERTWT